MKYSATGPTGLRAVWYSRGATLAELHAPDRTGAWADVVLGFDAEAGYASSDNQHFGCTTGRFANRIAGGKFTLDGREHQLAINNGPNHLHGGPTNDLSRKDWKGEAISTPSGPGVRFTVISPDGEEGYPGRLTVETTYILTDEGGVRIEYAATTDQPTIVNLTNHSYFNLAGHGSGDVLDHEVCIAADLYTPKDDVSIPTGELAPVAGTPLDFREFHAIGSRIDRLVGPDESGYDHNYVIRGKSGTVRLAAEARHPGSGRRLRVLADQPGMQFYTGNFLWGATCKAGRVYGRRTGFCFETQHFPDSPNKPQFPSTVLRPGQTYRHVCEYQLWAE